MYSALNYVNIKKSSAWFDVLIGCCAQKSDFRYKVCDDKWLKYNADYDNRYYPYLIYYRHTL